MQIRDGPAAVRGVAPPPKTTGSRAGKVAEGGAPSQKTFRAAANPEPLAEGGFVFRRLIILAGVAAARVRAGGPGARRAREGARRGQDDDDLRCGPADAHDRAERARGARRGQPRRRVLLPRPGHRLRAVRRPDRPLSGRRHRAAGATRSTASRLRSAPTRRRSRTATRCSGTGRPSRRAGGSPTLLLRKGAKRNCYAVALSGRPGRVDASDRRHACSSTGGA